MCENRLGDNFLKMFTLFLYVFLLLFNLSCFFFWKLINKRHLVVNVFINLDAFSNKVFC